MMKKITRFPDTPPQPSPKTLRLGRGPSRNGQSTGVPVKGYSQEGFRWGRNTGQFITLPLALLVTLLLAACGGDGPPRNASVVDVSANTEVAAWLNSAAEAFNDEGFETASGETAYVQVMASDAGNTITQIGAGDALPDLWLPDSEVWIDVLTQQNVAGFTATQADCRSIATSPLVIGMWRPVAEALGWPGRSIGWLDVGSLAADQSAWAYYSGGQFGPALRLGHTHPGLSATGTSTLLAVVQAAESTLESVSPADIEQPIVQASVQAFEGAVANFATDTDALGRTMSERGINYLGAASLYESTVLRYGDVDGDSVLDIIPVHPFEGTFVATHPACINRAAPEENQDAAQLFIDYLLDAEQQESAAQSGLRPVDEAVQASVSEAGSAIDFDQPQAVFGSKTVDSIYAVQDLWQSARKDVNLVMVLDTSGSMEGDKMQGMQTAAGQFVTQMGEDDRLSVIIFDDRPLLLVHDAHVGTDRSLIVKKIAGLYAGGGTALFDAIGAGAQVIEETTSTQTTNAMIVLTDGLDRNSVYFSADDTLVNAAMANDTAVYTIAYGGDDADVDLLGEIAIRANGNFYEGSEADIAAIYEDLSAAFGGSAGIGR